jgi:VanZ family protein
MAFIFWLGSDRGSSEVTGSFLVRLVRQFAPWLASLLGASGLELANFLVRKTGHFSGYGLLAMLDARALYVLFRLPARRAAFSGWGLASAWAAVDEYHQSFSPSRGASVEDVLLDSVGAACFLAVFQRWLFRAPRSH